MPSEANDVLASIIADANTLENASTSPITVKGNKISYKDEDGDVNTYLVVGVSELPEGYSLFEFKTSHGQHVFASTGAALLAQIQNV